MLKKQVLLCEKEFLGATKPHQLSFFWHTDKRYFLNAVELTKLRGLESRPTVPVSEFARLQPHKLGGLG